ncbi:MAG TPA: CRTAC1 family protein [Candidatus Limnocylindrales bacterium]|nr:CRTAC1 family protein [Candidatus Limnocylindrales bacterium]
MMKKRLVRKFWPALAVLIIGFSFPSLRAQKKRPASPITFQDVTRAAGIHFIHNNGAFGKEWLPEAMGSGVGFIDYNNDGWQDILLINGKDWPGHVRRHTYMALYRNNHNGTFTDVTRQAGLDVEMYGMGVAVGDYNNDGCDDIFVTALGQSHLFRNNCNGTFTDVTKQAGLWGPNEFSTSAAWVDYNRDGKLDLLVANYVRWTPKTDIYCTLDGRTKSYCTPQAYHGTSLRLWRNNGNGTFTDVTKQAGLYDPTSKSLGITILDANNDGWPDIFVSNDTQPNKLYINNGNGTFTEKAVMSGVGFSDDGVARAGMGAASADYDHSGYPSILVSNFSNQMLALYHNERNGLFVDEAPHSEIGHSSLLTLGFGCFFFDYDNDGWPDIFVANGHIQRDIQTVQRDVHYAEPPLLFHNLGNGTFADATREAGASFNVPRVARGAAYGDVYNNGKLDILVSTNPGSAVLFRNEGGTNHSLRVKLAGTRSNRDGIGAVVDVTAGGMTQDKMLTSGSSYLSSSELVLTFGLGQNTSVSKMEIHWPSGHVDRLKDIAAGQTVTVKEGSGIVGARPYEKD